MISKGEQKGNLYGFYCLSSDLTDLTARAKELKCWQGSWAYCIDDGSTYMWDSESEEWREQ